MYWSLSSSSSSGSLPTVVPGFAAVKVPPPLLLQSVS